MSVPNWHCRLGGESECERVVRLRLQLHSGSCWRGEWGRRGCGGVRWSHLFSISICSAAFTSQTAPLPTSPPCWQGWSSAACSLLSWCISLHLHCVLSYLWQLLFGLGLKLIHPPETLHAHPSLTGFSRCCCAAKLPLSYSRLPITCTCKSSGSSISLCPPTYSCHYYLSLKALLFVIILPLSLFLPPSWLSSSPAGTVWRVLSNIATEVQRAVCCGS